MSLCIVSVNFLKILNMFSVIKRSARFLKFGGSLIRRKPLGGVFCTDTCHDSSSIGGPNINELTNGDKELEHKLKVLILEVDVMRQEGKMVPDECYMKNKHWQELLTLPSFSARRRFLEFVFKNQKKRENRDLKKEQKKLENGTRLEKKESETFEEFVSQYDLAHNNILLRIYDTTINQLYNNRLVQAMKFGQKLVIDLGYDQDMTIRENKNCAKQLTLLFAENRNHDDPFDLHFCNINKKGVLMETLGRNIGTLYEPCFPLHLHESSYLERFPKDQLVYLTPHCREELTVYDHDAIYIIGGIVDKVNTQPLSLAKAKKEGVRMAKFPLDKYLQWGAGSGKSLTLNQVISILLDMKITGDWKYALRHVPRRKIIENITPQKCRFDRKMWTPSAKIDFNNLGYKDRTSKKRKVEIKSIIYD